MACPCLIDDSSTLYDAGQGSFYDLPNGAIGDGVLYATDPNDGVLYSWTLPGLAGPTTVYTAAANHLLLAVVVGLDGSVYVLDVDTAATPDQYVIKRVLPTVATVHTFAAGVSVGAAVVAASGALVGLKSGGNDLVSIDLTTGVETTLAAATNVQTVVPTLDGALWCVTSTPSIQRRNASGTVTMTLAEDPPNDSLLPAPTLTDAVLSRLSTSEPQVIQPDGSYAPWGCTTAPAINKGVASADNGYGVFWSPDQSTVMTATKSSLTTVQLWDWTCAPRRRFWVGSTGFSR